MDHLADGATVPGDGVALTAIHTPGHASDHLCYYLAEETGMSVESHLVKLEKDGRVSEEVVAGQPSRWTLR